MRLYLPELGDLIRLTEPLVIRKAELNTHYEINHAIWRIIEGEKPYDWPASQRLTEATLEPGTVLAFRRYFVSVHAKTNDVEVSIFAHPRRDLTPKKNGGTGQMVKLVLPLAVLNRIEYEKVER